MMQQLDDALQMIDIFASVGASRFDLTLTDIDGDKRSFRASQSIIQLKNSLPKLFPGALTRRSNIIVRPLSKTIHLIQLDDLDAAALGRVGEAAFLALETSPGNHQAWLAVTEFPTQLEVKTFARRLRKGTGADATASGATRVAGTLNYKRKYEPNFPLVRIESALLGKVVSASQMIEAGLVSPFEKERLNAIRPVRVSRRSETLMRTGKWPDYQRCLESAPPNHANTGPDTSRADFTWCMTALDWGFDAEETAGRLMEVSIKAKQNGLRYAELTARNAAEVVAARARPAGRA